MAGRLRTITEVGIDGTSTRIWRLTWAGPDLIRIERPDGTKLELFYTASVNPSAVARYSS